jgi:gamma-glutamylcyclotransferase (GGCT)/AIG2-like uncharacterized protein YtfP
MTTTNRLFVYGTLAPGRPNHYVLADVPGEWEPASISGRLLNQGWGAEHGFPGLVLDENGPDQVDGVLFTSERLTEHWERLDEFEGDGYERVLTVVRLPGGRVAEAYVYVLRQSPDGAATSHSG